MSNTKTNPNDLATAYGYCNEQDHFDSNGGLTKREHFAAMAMQGFISRDGHMTLDKFAEYSVKMADALIEQLNKQAEQ